MEEVKWSVDTSHSEVGFKIRHLMISYVKGVFKKFDALVHTNGNDFSTARINFWIDVDSISTGDEKRDEHLRSVEFFDTKNYQQINFKCDSLKETQERNFVLTGDLTIKEITKQVKLTAEFGGLMKDPWGNLKAGFTITGRINRKDWGLIWNSSLENGGVMLGEDVLINCEIQLIKNDNRNKELQSEASEEQGAAAI